MPAKLNPPTVTRYCFPAEAARTRWIECTEADIPASVRFDVPAQNQGQMVEIAFGTFGRAEAGPGDPWKRITDRSDGAVAYYRRVRA